METVTFDRYGGDDLVSQAWGHRLLEVGFAVQKHVRTTVIAGGEWLACPVAEEGGDTIYGIDRDVDSTIKTVIDGWSDECMPLTVIAEGMGSDGTNVFGDSQAVPAFKMIIDPIDGTRNLMYDKRSAWFLAAVAPNQGEDTDLASAVAAVIVELPTSKQAWADWFLATAGKQTIGRRKELDGSQEVDLQLRPSTASTLKDGFAHVSNFFPGTKVLASELMERIVKETVGEVRPGRADVFDDQYVSTGGQMVELILGRDRFCCDLRPLLYDILEKDTGRTVRGIECHPYDIAGSRVAQQAGVIVTDGFGRPLNAGFNIHQGIHWCGYANLSIQEQVQPVILAWLKEHGLSIP